MQSKRDGPDDPGASDELKLARILAEYVDRHALGDSPGLEEFVTEHPELRSPQLLPELEALEELEALVEDKPRSPAVRLGDFRIIREIGGGGMGKVYEAEQISLSRRVALKVIRPGHLASAKEVARFHREAKAAASLEHPNVVTIYALGVEDDAPYYAMELIEGETLQGYLTRKRSSVADTQQRMTPGSPVESSGRTRLFSGRRFRGGYPEDVIASQLSLVEVDGAYCLRLADTFAGVTEGLQHAHSRGIIHRDLKPSNLILDSDGRLRILDFGLAWVEGELRLTRSHERLGTPLYMSPEQAQGRLDLLGPASDIYSLGATLYEMLLWRPTVAKSSVEETLHQIINVDPIPLRRINPRIPRDLETILLKCLRKEPRDRYGTAEALAQDLRRFVRGDPIEARPQPFHERILRQAWRMRGKIAQRATAAALMGLLAFLLVVNPILNGRKERLGVFHDLIRSGATILHVEEFLSSTPSISQVDFKVVPLNATSVLGSPEREEALMRSDPDWDRLVLAENHIFEAGPLLGPEPDRVEDAAKRLEEAVSMFPREAIGHYHLARGRLLQANKAQALSHLREAVRLDPAFAPAQALLASILERMREPDARSEAQAIRVRLGRTSGDEWSRWIEARQSAEGFDWKKAAQAYEDLVARSDLPVERRIEALFGAVLAHLNDGAAVLALPHLARAKERWGEGVELDLAEARIHLLNRDRKTADTIFNAMKTRRVPLDDALVRRIALAYAGAREYDTANKWLEEMHECADKHRLQAEFLSRLDRSSKMEEALKHAQAAVQMAPESVPARLTLGEVLRQMGRLDDAVEYFQGTSEKAPEGEARPLVGLGLCREAQGRLDDAERSFRDAARRDPGLWQAQYNLARILVQLEKREEAREIYEGIVARDRRNALAWNNLGCLLDEDGKLVEALDAYRWAARAAPYFALARHNLGWALHRQKRFGEALEEYQKAEEYGLEKDVDLLSRMAACYQWQNDYEDALSRYRKAIQLEPARPLLHQSLATLHTWSSLDGGWPDLLNARDSYRRALQLAPGWASVHNDLGWVLELLGEAQEARKEFEEALRLNPGNVWALNSLASLLYRQGTPLPGGEDLRKAIELLEGGLRLPNAGPAATWLLDRYRPLLLPDLASFASIDWRCDAPHVLVPDQAAWKLHRGRTEPDREWMAPSFDDASWESGEGPFGYPQEMGVKTHVPDMLGGYGSLYLRHAFTVEEPDRVRELVLSVRFDDAFIAYLNGQEVARFRAGEDGGAVPSGALADGDDSEPWTALDFPVPRGLLGPGRNVLAVQGLNSAMADRDFVLSPVLKAVLVLDDARRKELEGALDAFRNVMAGEDSAARLAYFEGRLLEAGGNPLATEAWFREAAERDPHRAEPILRLAASLERRDEAEAAEGLLHDSLSGTVSPGPAADPRVWDAWLQLALVRLGRTPGEVLARFPAPRGGQPAHRAGDIRWLLGQLGESLPLRITSGAGDHAPAQGERWSRDRFFLGGDMNYLRRVHERGIPGPLYQMERFFRHGGVVVRGYRIPLPKGRYRVTLHFIEGWHAEPGKRVFDVILEGKTVLSRYDPGEKGICVPDPRVFEPISVDDGSLDIDFRRRVDLPKISGIEIERL